jgi:hypothetical protein
LPSIDDVAMWILFDGVFGTTCCSFGLREAAAGDAWLSEMLVAGRRGLFGTDFTAASGLAAVGRGGGNGEIETAVTDAEWAW